MNITTLNTPIALPSFLRDDNMKRVHAASMSSQCDVEDLDSSLDAVQVLVDNGTDLATAIISVAWATGYQCNNELDMIASINDDEMPIGDITCEFSLSLSSRMNHKPAND